MHDRAAVVGTPVGVAEVRALLELPLLAVDDVLPIYGDKIVSVGAHVGVVHADAVEDLEGIHVPTLCIISGAMKKNQDFSETLSTLFSASLQTVWFT